MVLFIYSLKHSIPILIGFIPVGLAYGVLMQANGLNWLWTGASSILIFAGSLQFLAVSFFAGGVSLITVAIMALLLNSRHIFYGIPFIEKRKCLYLAGGDGRGQRCNWGGQCRDIGYVKALAQNYYGIQDVRQISAAGLDIQGADVDAIMKAAEDSVAGMDQSL